MISAEERRNSNGINISLDNIIWIIIHLGINPVNGGRPPRDKSLRGIVKAENKDVWLGLNKSEIKVDWREWKKKTTEDEIKE